MVLNVGRGHRRKITRLRIRVGGRRRRVIVVVVGMRVVMASSIRTFGRCGNSYRDRRRCGRRRCHRRMLILCRNRLLGTTTQRCRRRRRSRHRRRGGSSRGRYSTRTTATANVSDAARSDRGRLHNHILRNK